jgi:hypothetical protein
MWLVAEPLATATHLGRVANRLQAGGAQATSSGTRLHSRRHSAGNHRRYDAARTEVECRELLARVLVGNCLSVAKAFGLRVAARLVADAAQLRRGCVVSRSWSRRRTKMARKGRSPSATVAEEGRTAYALALEQIWQSPRDYSVEIDFTGTSWRPMTWGYFALRLRRRELGQSEDVVLRAPRAEGPRPDYFVTDVIDKSADKIPEVVHATLTS